MKHHLHYYRSFVKLAAATALTLSALSSCSSDPTATTPLDPTRDGALEIRLSSTVGEAATRSYTATNLISGDTVYVWTDMVDEARETETEYFNAWALKANGAGGLTTLLVGDTKLFPATNPLNFYALAGNFGQKTVGEDEVPKVTPGETLLPTEGILHTVLKDQTTAEAYYKSDLLYAVRKKQEPVSAAVVLPFRHMLCRIQVVLVAANGMTPADLGEAEVELLDLYRQVTFSPDKAKDYTKQEDRSDMLDIPTLWAARNNILLGNNAVASTTAADAMSYADAIVVPQTIARGTPFIKVTYLGRETFYRIPADADLVLESGKQYRFRLLADRIGDTYLAVPEFDDWTELPAEDMNLLY